MERKLKIDFFHDVICSWCYVLSSRMHKLAEEFPELEIVHHSFALSKDSKDTIRMFGSMENAKKEIMKHWRASNINGDGKINADLMESRDFEYPSSLNGLRGCKSAELQGGQAAHWTYFDLVQQAHLTEARNIGDRNVLIDLAEIAGLNIEKFIKDFDSEDVLMRIEEDIRLARAWSINSVPTIMINEEVRVPGAIEYKDLKALIVKALSEVEH